MTAVIIIVLVLAFLFTINIEFHIDNTIWKDNETDRPIIVIRYDEDGVTYKYMEDPFERHMSLWDLITKFKYEGE